MDETRLRWEPKGSVSKEIVRRQVAKYMENKADFAQFSNGTCLMLRPVSNMNETIRGSMAEAKRLPDFKVYSMEDGDFLVFFASALLVYVGKEEVEQRKAELQSRIEELKFPGESMVAPSGMSELEMMVGLYGRGKLQRDARMNEPYEIVNRIE